MKKRIITFIFLICLIGITGVYLYRTEYTGIKSKVYAVGDLTIDWGLPLGQPIFSVTNALPGDTESRIVTITNDGPVSRTVAMKGNIITETLGFPDILDFSVRLGGIDTYGGTSPGGSKTIRQWIMETSVSAIPILIINSGETKQIEFRVYFPENSGNEYQNASTVFDITLGIESIVPPECEHIAFSGEPIFGTSKSEIVRGTRGNDLIFALEGNDTVYGYGGNDCLVGGEGNDTLRGETGNDVLFGGNGKDRLYGGVGNDLIFGGDGNDRIDGEDGIDILYGNIGDDTIEGGDDADTIYGNEGNDEIDGENGIDTVEGNSGDDEIDGGSGNDMLYGNDGYDEIDGEIGIDTCEGEKKKRCEL